MGLAYVFSLAAVLMPGWFPQEFCEHDGAVGTYFEAAAVIVTLVILGDMLQLRAMGQTNKTGTLTLGHPALTDFVADGIPENEALALVAGVEQLSEHPIGLAIVEGAKARGLTPQSAGAFNAVNGLGVQVDIDGKRVLVGSRSFLTQRGVDSQQWEARAEAWRAEAKTVVFFAVNGIAAGIAAVADPIKESTREAIAALKRSGVRIVMLTGDSRSTAEAVCAATRDRGGARRSRSAITNPADFFNLTGDAAKRSRPVCCFHT